MGRQDSGSPAERRRAFTVGALQGVALGLAVLIVLYLASYIIF